MAYVHFDNKYAPVGFLVVPDGGDPYADDTPLIQSDWEYPAVARDMGWTSCCEDTNSDGTVDCRVCRKTASQMIKEAYDFIEAHAGESFESLDQYLE
jgi:hypothetical protein